MATKNLRIVRSGISVYEIEVDLGRYAGISTSRIRGFTNRLLRMFPALRQHECYAGEAGGFVDELRIGTDLAHVMEHLILELLKAASGSGQRFTGWTRKKGKHHVIHFQAPDGPTGRCAAAGALRIIEGILNRTRVSKQAVIRTIRESKEVHRCN